jgi:acyl carrier protein
MPGPLRFFEKSPDQIRLELAGFPALAVEAALRFRALRRLEDLDQIIAGSIALYRPKASQFPLEALSGETRLREELGLDSLTLTEMVFKFDEMLGVPIDTREAMHIQTFGELTEFLRLKLRSADEPNNSKE